jgi:hypothetical protein
MAHEREADRSEATSWLADSGEKAIRNLVALPLRMLVGTLHIMEAPLENAVATLRGTAPVDRFAELERRVDSLEQQATLQSTRSSAAARPAVASVGPERVEQSARPHEAAQRSETAASDSGA